MTFVLPNPNVPTNGQTGDATPILQNELAIANAINSFDGSQINAKSIVEASLADAINPRLRGSETLANFIYTGLVWSTLGGLNGSMTGGTLYINGYRTVVSGFGSHTFVITQDTYVDVDYLGNVTYNAVSNGSTAPSLAANSIRMAKIVTDGSAIASITQFGADGLGNIIYPTGPTTPKTTQNPCKFACYLTSATNSGNNAFAVVNFNVKEFDTGNNIFSGVLTAPFAGFYQFNWVIEFAGAAQDCVASLFKNGTEVRRGSGRNNTNTSKTSGGGGMLQLAANDIIDVRAFASATTALDVGQPQCYFTGFLVSTS